MLPVGPIQLQNGVLYHKGWIVGLDLDRTVALVRIPRHGSRDPRVAMEQLAGWLCGKGRRVIRIRGCGPRQRIFSRMRYPVQGRSILVYWCRTHVAELELRTGRDLPPNVLVEIAIRDVWRKAAKFWQDTSVLLQALESIDANILLDLSYNVVNVARAWEYRLARLERRATNEGWIESEDRSLIAGCDRYWKICVGFIPAYRMLPHTMYRLL